MAQFNPSYYERLQRRGGKVKQGHATHGPEAKPVFSAKDRAILAAMGISLPLGKLQNPQA